MSSHEKLLLEIGVLWYLLSISLLRIVRWILLDVETIGKEFHWAVGLAKSHWHRPRTTTKNGAGMSEINSSDNGYSSVAIGTGTAFGGDYVQYWFNGPSAIGMDQGNLPLNDPFGSFAGRSPSPVALDPLASNGYGASATGVIFVPSSNYFTE